MPKSLKLPPCGNSHRKDELSGAGEQRSTDMEPKCGLLVALLHGSGNNGAVLFSTYLWDILYLGQDAQ